MSKEYCINKKLVCDGQKDCQKGEDEKDCPKRKPCDSNSKCSQLCIVTAEGKDACSCHIGYKLAEDETTLVLINTILCYFTNYFHFVGALISMSVYLKRIQYVLKHVITQLEVLHVDV